MSDFDLSSINLSEIFPRPKRKAVRKGKKVKRVPVKNPTPWGYKIGEREICDLRTAAGKREYESRIDKMVRRQNGWCKCKKFLRTIELTGYLIGERPTFGHDIPRGNGGMNRDDRIWDSEGKPMNHAECLDCNMAKGSKRSTD
jgi:hypothetical protein